MYVNSKLFFIQIDAPAIKRADVGVAMGQAGTEITKQAADIVLVDDNFTSIVKAVEEGRHVFDNILKFIVYLLSCNGAEIFLMLICTIANIEVPLSVMMILWANIIGMYKKKKVSLYWFHQADLFFCII